jgi:hypothetical protein
VAQEVGPVYLVLLEDQAAAQHQMLQVVVVLQLLDRDIRVAQQREIQVVEISIVVHQGVAAQVARAVPALRLVGMPDQQHMDMVAQGE